jgi:hypothetical protein
VRRLRPLQQALNHERKYGDCHQRMFQSPVAIRCVLQVNKVDLEEHVNLVVMIFAKWGR